MINDFFTCFNFSFGKETFSGLNVIYALKVISKEITIRGTMNTTSLFYNQIICLNNFYFLCLTDFTIESIKRGE